MWYHDATQGANGNTVQVLAFARLNANYDVVFNVIGYGPTSHTGLALVSPGGARRAVISLSPADDDGGAATFDDDALVGGRTDRFGANAWRSLSHEARPTDDDRHVLTLLDTVKTVVVDGDDGFGNASALPRICLQGAGCSAVSKYLSDHVARWDLATGALEVAYDLDDFANPVATPLGSSDSMTWVTCDWDNATTEALDWSHTSAIADAAGDAYIVSMRDINTVAAVYKNGSGVKWSLSASAPAIPSSLRFENDDAKFYNVHDAQLVSVTRGGDDDDDGGATEHLLLLDDGNNRPGCVPDGFTSGIGCFTRAARYELDFEAGVARLKWQFEYGYEWAGNASMALLRGVDLFVTDGGSVTEWDDAYVFVAFTVTDVDSVFGNYSYVFQVDKYDQAKVYSCVKVPREIWAGTGDAGMYRARPYDSVAGEGFTSPFDQTSV